MIIAYQRLIESILIQPNCDNILGADYCANAAAIAIEQMGDVMADRLHNHGVTIALGIVCSARVTRCKKVLSPSPLASITRL